MKPVAAIDMASANKRRFVKLNINNSEDKQTHNVV